MIKQIPQNLVALAKKCPAPLYVVGGSVRDFLCGYPLKKDADWDVSSPATEDEVLEAALSCGFQVKSVYRHTGTVKLQDGNGASYEFTRFRSDKYVRGLHAPQEVTFTRDIALDARRRDFCANAVYYDIAAERFSDPLGGIDDIKNKILRTVAPAEKVFGEDGLRLIRLARIAAQTGFSPDADCLAGAKRNAALVKDVVPERVFSELTLLLHADEKHGDKDAPYRGLCILRDTGVLKEILPELAAGAGMQQRKDFHDHDVLEHSLRCVRYAPPEIRFAALLHDVGKPFCLLRDGKYHCHAEEGARIATEILTRLKAPKQLTRDTATLVLLHMRDLTLAMRESKVRRTIVEYFPLVPRLIMLFQADYSACKDDMSPAPAAVKWQDILDKMEREGAPREIKDLAINGKEAQDAGVPPFKTGEALEELLYYAAEDGARNTKTQLLKLLEKKYRANGGTP